MRALIFEDDLLLASLITEALSHICDSVMHFATLRDLQDHRSTLTECPGLVWMDLRAHGNTVSEALAETRAVRECCQNSIIVVMTGMPMNDVRDAAFDAGADVVEGKPFHVSILYLARVIAIGALKAMERGSSDSVRVLENVVSMAIKYFQKR